MIPHPHGQQHHTYDHGIVFPSCCSGCKFTHLWLQIHTLVCMVTATTSQPVLLLIAGYTHVFSVLTKIQVHTHRHNRMYSFLFKRDHIPSILYQRFSSRITLYAHIFPSLDYLPITHAYHTAGTTAAVCCCTSPSPCPPTTFFPPCTPACPRRRCRILVVSGAMAGEPLIAGEPPMVACMPRPARVVVPLRLVWVLPVSCRPVGALTGETCLMVGCQSVLCQGVCMWRGVVCFTWQISVCAIMCLVYVYILYTNMLIETHAHPCKKTTTTPVCWQPVSWQAPWWQ